MDAPAIHQDAYRSKLTSAERAVAALADGAVVSCGMAIGQPPALLAALAARLRAGDLARLRLYYQHAMDPLSDTLLADDLIEKVDAHTFFIAGRDHAVIRRQLETGRRLVSFVPVHFSQVPRLFEEQIALDAFLVTVSPMDAGGHFSLGTNNDFASSAARRCRRLLVEVNRHMPRVFGQSQLHVSEVAAIVEHHAPLPEAGAAPASPEGLAIGKLVAPLVPNGATIQLGIGRVPSGVARALAGHEDLGLHSELLTPAIVELVDRGVLTGRRKPLHRGKHVFTFALGDAATWARVDDDAAFESYPVDYVNDVRVIARHDDFVSINTAIEVDLFGQVNAEYVGGHEYSGSGGHYDFVKGASLAKRGRSIVALASTAKQGTRSTIVPRVPMVTDLRTDIEWVATEHGLVNLRGRSTRERAEALISIAHPEFRGELAAEARRIALV